MNSVVALAEVLGSRTVDLSQIRRLSIHGTKASKFAKKVGCRDFSSLTMCFRERHNLIMMHVSYAYTTLESTYMIPNGPQLL